MRTTVFLAATLCALVATEAAVTSAEAAQRIGVASAVSNRVTGAIGGKTKRLRAGDAVVQNEVVRTRAKSTAQFLFRDETALTPGPGSRVKLDRFVYDPDRRIGKIVINATKGAFRFVSGAARSSSYRIKTPAATIGVRGTVFDWFIDNGGNLIVVLVRGAVDVCPNRRRCIAITRPGHYVAVKRDGTATRPRSSRGQLWNVARGVPFPLFGTQVNNDFSAPPDTRDFIDERGFGANPGGIDPGGQQTLPGISPNP